ncbi:TolC family protein, partial [Halobacteriovorax sp.]|uniref:TolC family protein n=1 Tax=Halobacteriovorax sp. TaxID=2020862 RepID=UPI00356268C1
TEELIKTEVDNSAPNTLAIESTFLSLDFQREAFEENFDVNLIGSANYYKTNENSFSSFAPVSSPIKSYKVGLEKGLSSGMKVGVNTFSEQYTNSYVNKGTTSGFGLQFSMDLYKNFLGKLTSSQRNLLKETVQRADLQKNIQKKAFYQSLRKVYWSLVANNEQLKISQKLLSLSQKQLKDSKDKFRNKIAEISEVSRSESQIADRKSRIINLQYQREVYIQQIKELLPSLSNKDISLGAYSIDDTSKELLSCIAQISSFNEPPLQYSSYDEILKSLQSEFTHQRNITDSYNKANVQLVSEVRRLGKTQGYSESWDKLSDDGRTSYSAGIELKIPLGGSTAKSKELQELLDKKRFISQKEEIVGRVNAYHSQVVKNISLLQKVIQQQNINSEKLAVTLKHTKKKYNQARVSFRDLILDQDALLSSNLLEVESQLAIITTLLDYFTVYTEMPCKINK